LTPPEICRVGDPWRVRVFPNKYPATEHHEVVVESPRHDDTFDAIDHAADAVRVYADRYHALSRIAPYVSIFKNSGAMAGASIPHLHSQIIATPFVPPRVAREAAAFHEKCALCAISEEPLIRETASYRWIAPRGSMFAYEQWIVPKEHAPEIAEPLELADLLQASAAAMRRITPSFNWIFMNFPRQPRAHWYVQLFPRLAVHAGFELGSGSAINAVDPAEAARTYRQYCE
jgi:UDPglucose--hexose-1-phosphate uridylyltransferase